MPYIPYLSIISKSFYLFLQDTSDTVDAFTNKPFTGNPAGVCILDKVIDDNLMLKIASEINFSETAFVISDKTNERFNLRWFTPTEEVDLCGHATLATAKILYEKGLVDKNKKFALL